MAKIVVFDSGLGSLSIIKPIQKLTKSEIIYFADQQNYPYGKKSKEQLSKIINETIIMLQKKFNPDYFIVGSNTPTLLLGNLGRKIFGVTPPLQDAIRKTKTYNIAILATQSVVNSKELLNYIKEENPSKKINIHLINASKLVDLVEYGIFLTNRKLCSKIIKKTLYEKFKINKIDVATLSSTHLPFLNTFLMNQFPDTIFLDPAEQIVKKISKRLSKKQSSRNSLKIFTSGNPKSFQINLEKIGIKNKVSHIL